MKRLGTCRGIVRARTNRTIAFYGLVVVEIKVCGIHPTRMQKPTVKQNGPDDEQRRRHQQGQDPGLGVPAKKKQSRRGAKIKATKRAFRQTVEQTIRD